MDISIIWSYVISVSFVLIAVINTVIFTSTIALHNNEK